MKPIPKLALVLPPEGMPGLIYLGCHERPGHHFFTAGMRGLYSVAPAYQLNAYVLHQLDGRFAPQDTEEEGLAWFHCATVNDIPYMVISFWDRSVDERYGSNSTFLIIGQSKCFNDALADCKAAFPEVFRRFKFEVKLRRNMFIE